MSYGGIDTGFGGASQFAGGGFMTSHADDGAGGSKAVNAGLPETLRSMTVAQLRKITIVGLVASKQVTDTHVILTVYDGTGVVEIKQYLDKEGSQLAEYLNPLAEGRYIRVYGHYKTNIENTNLPGYVFAFNIRPVEDHNEVVYHNLDVIYQHLFLTQGQNGSGAANMANMGGMPMGGRQPQGAPALQPMQNIPMGGAPAPGGGNSVQAVISYLQSDEVANTEHGAHVSQIVRVLAGQYNEMQVRQAVDLAMNEGHCYTTANDETFKAV